MGEFWRRTGYSSKKPIEANYNDRENFNAPIIKAAKIADKRWLRRQSYILIKKGDVNYPFIVNGLGKKGSYKVVYSGNLPEDDTTVIGLTAEIGLKLMSHRFDVLSKAKTVPAQNFSKKI